MTRQEHLEWCKKCTNRYLDINQGIVCNVTGIPANFENSCSDYQHDPAVATISNRVEDEKEPEIIQEQLVTQLDEHIVSKFRIHQDFYYAVTGGTLAMLVSAILWAVITVTIKFQAAYMAIGLGLIVGLAVRFFGAGIDKKFGYLGGALSFLGCLLGNLLSQVGFIAHEYSLGYLETITYLNSEIVISILVETFHPMDLIFYGFAIYQGYQFAFRKITTQLAADVGEGKSEALPDFYNLRFPLVIGSIVVLSLVIIQVSRGVSGPKSYYYESGKLLSEGELKRSKEHGKWTIYYEDGAVFSTGFYHKGELDSIWHWYNENGTLSRSGKYKRGFEHGPWVSYTEMGNPIDSVWFVNGRKNGYFFLNYEHGPRAQNGYYDRDKKSDLWEFFYENGQLIISGMMQDDSPDGKWISYFENGTKDKEVLYGPDNLYLILNAWDVNGNQLVKDGNGFYRSFSAEGIVLSEGEVVNGERLGTWKFYFEDGRLREEGTFEDDILVIRNSWNMNNEQTVADGMGLYASYFAGNGSVYEIGAIQNGHREGEWFVYHESTGITAQKSNYKNGKLHGETISYFETGEILSKGYFEDGKMNGNWIWYHENESISSTVNYINHKKEGKQIFYTESGLHKREEIYKNDMLVKEKW
jgi:antitoxin component YwqK of YwqJK toxin-antitoxin module